MNVKFILSTVVIQLLYVGSFEMARLNKGNKIYLFTVLPITTTQVAFESPLITQCLHGPIK